MKKLSTLVISLLRSSQLLANHFTVFAAGKKCLPVFVDDRHDAPAQQASFTINKIAIMRTSVPKLKIFAIAVVLMMANLFFVSNAVAQRFAVTTGNWNGAIWATTAGGVAGSAATPVAGDPVTINSGVVVTVNTAGAVCSSITVTAPSVINGITITSPGTLTVGAGTGSITMNSPTTGTVTSTIAVGTGSLSAGSIAIPGSGSANRFCTVSVSTGIINLTGAITFSGTAAQARLTFSGAGTLNIGGNLGAGGTFTASTGTVEFYGDGTGGTTANQSVGAYTYNNLTLSGSGVKTFGTTATVNGTLSIQGTATTAGTSPNYGGGAILEYKGSGIQVTSNVEFPSTGTSVDLVIDNTNGVTLNGSKTTFSGGVTVKSGSTFALSTFNFSTPTSISLDGSSITGSGTLTLGGNVTTTANAITSNISAPIALGTTTRSFTIASGAANPDLNISSVVSGTGGVTKAGTGILYLSGSNSFSGAVTISAGMLRANTLANSGSNSSLGTGSTTATISIGATGTLQYTGSGHSTSRAITLSGSGATIDASGSGTMTLSGGVTGNTNNLVLTGTGVGVESGVIGTTSGTLTKNGGGTWTLSTANTFTGGATLNAGTLNINNASALGTVAGTFTINGGAVDNTTAGTINTVNYPLALNGDFTYTGSLSRTLNLGTGTTTLNADRNITVSAGTLTIGGTISAATRSLTKSGAGTLSFGSAAVTLNGLTISTGTLTSTSGTLSLAGDFTNNGTYIHNSGLVTFNGNNALQTISGSSSSAFNSIAINKGTSINNILEATGPMSMAGQTTITNGTFKLTHASASGQFNGVSNITLPATGGLWINGGSWTTSGISVVTTSGSLVRCSAGSLSVGSSSGNSLQIVAGATLTMEGGTLNISGRLINSGSTSFSGGTTNLATVGLGTGSNAAFEMTATSNLTMTSGSPLIVFQNANSTLPGSGTTGGDLLIRAGGTKSITNGTFQFGNSSTPASQIFNIYSDLSISNLSVNGFNSPTARLRTATLNLTGGITIASGGTLDAATNNININLGGNWSNSGTYSGGTSTFTMNGTSPQTMIGSTFYNLAINNTSGVTLNSAETITNNLSLTAGSTLNLGTFTHSAGTLTLGGGATASGSWGSTSSAATHKNDTYFSATTGIVNVTTATCTAPATPVIGGSATVCAGATGSVYSVTNVAGDTYAWTVVGGTITGGDGTNSITVTWGTAGAGTVDVSETITATGCSAAATQFAVTINAVPSLTITNPAAVCSPSTVNLTLPAVTAGSTLNGGTLSYWNDIDATSAVADPTAVGAGPYYIKATNSCGSDIKLVTVTVNANYTITASAGSNGSISPSGVTTLTCLGTGGQTFTITADACYTIADVLVDGVSVGAVGTYDFTNVTAAHTIAASFTLSTYNITASAGTGGSISPSGAVSVNCGANQSFTITADACYTIADVLVDGVSVGAVGTYDFTNVTAAHTIAASFTLSTYNITASAGTGGSISPSGAVSVNCGASQSFTITADGCHTIADVLVDGVSVGAVGTYDFTNVTAAHTIAASFNVIAYTITASAGSNGSISPSGSVSVNCGANQSFTITADACYTIADVLVDGVSVGAVGTYDFTNVTAAHTIAASFTLSTYNITASAGTGGSISPSGAVSVNCGANQSFTITADACHTIADVLVDGVSVGAVGTYDFTNVTAAHTIAASFNVIAYTITASAGTNGSISPSGAVSVNCGANQSFTITADACYTIADVLVDGVSVGAVGTYDFTNVTAAHTIAASFTLSTYNITASAGTGGSISPSGSVSVNCGASQSFTITADACYTIADVLVDGVSVGAVGTYDFTNVTAAHTIAASFTLSTYNITASAGTGGSISPSGSVSVNCGASQSFTITADACYTIADVLVDGVSVGAVGTYDFTNVTAAHTIAASFTLSTYNITASAGTGGSISPSGSVSVNCGASQSFTITADACYTIADVLVDGVSVGAVGTYDFTNVTAAHTIAASFTLSTYNITASAGTGGSISPSGAVSVNCGANQSFTITADACHTIADVLVDGVSVGAVGTYDFTNVTAAHTIAASFNVIAYTITASAGTNGSISPSGAVSVNCGANQSFTITADACYTIADVLVDGVSVGAVGTYDFTNVTAAHTIAASFTLSTYNITASAGTGGSISPSGSVSVNCGASQSFTITADACYTIADVLVDGVSVGAVGTYDFTNVTAAHTIAASFTLSTYNITASAGTGGTISPSGAVSVNCGANQSFTITADGCHTIADVLVDGVSVGAVGTYDFTNVTAAHTIAASFNVIAYTITASAGSNGSISPSGSVSVNCGANQSFTITADACYTIADVLVDGVSVGAVGTYDFTNVTAAHTIAASFTLSTYNITASAGTGGSISPSGAVSVNCGANQSFTITADACYTIADVLVDGVSVGAVGTYDFTNVTAAHTIAASFTLSTYNITASAGTGGTISPSGAVSVNCGANQSFTITADGCHTIADVLVDGVSVGAVGTYDFTNVTAAHTIAASFNVIAYTITASAGSNGSISPSGSVSVNCGANQSFTITADACYTIADVLVDGVSVGAVGTYDFTNVTAAHTIAASFTLSTYNITASAGTGGSISPSGAVSVNCGANQSFTITADACYTIADVLVDGVSVGAVGTYDFTNVTAAHTIAASFTLSTYNITASAGTGGSISPSGAVSVNCGASQSFTITADGCHTIADVLVDGVSVGAVGTYDFTNVTAAHTIAASFNVIAYTITASAGSNGSISPSGSVSVNCGANQSFTITADACYTIADVLVDGVSVGAVGTYDFTNVTAAHTIAASFTLSTYNITASAGTGGSISPSGAVSVNCGANQSFTITADACHTIADVLVDGVSVGAVGTYDFTNVTAAHTIAASFTLSTYNITASAGTGGSISPSGSVSVNCGANQSFTITADACYTIADVLVDGVSVGAVGTYDFTNVTAAHTIAASFTLSTYNITASAGTGGSISPSGSVSVNCGASQSFTITADACYTIADVLVDGVSVGAVGTYDFTNVTAAHTIAASFTLSTYNITASAGTGGSISPSGSVSVNCGASQSFTITADACYTIADVLVDGVSVGAVGTYDFTNVTAAHTIAASFTLSTYNITASAGTGGSISPSGSVSVNCGASQSFTITADACYTIADVLVDGVSVGAVGTYDFTNVTAAHTIAASFTLSTYNITASAGTGGSISPSGAVSVNCGANQSFTITADACYTIADVLVDGVSVGAVGTYDFTNVTAAHTIAASFTLSTYNITASAGTGGTISPSGAVSVNCGANQSFTITADGCHTIADVLVDGVSVGAVGTYDFTNVTAAHTIAASFNVIAYTITASAGSNGSISPSGAVSVNCGANQSFTITADACYTIADVLVDGVSVGAVGTYDFTNVTAAHTIAASFTLSTYNITASAGTGGSISPSGSVSVNCGANQSFTITADACYTIADVLVDGVSVGAVGTYDFTNVTAAHTIAASFTLSTYNITASAGTGGSISPSGAVSVNCGANQSFTITADACYTIADVLVDGVSVGAVGTYDFTNVTAAHTIAASFTLSTYNITASAGTGGSISPSGSVSVNCGANQSFTITADACYTIADVLVDGVSVGAVGTYDFTNVTAAHTIAASFTLSTYNITASAGTGGSISPSGAVSVNCGANQSFTITADACYTIADVLVDGVSVGAVGTYDFTNVTAAHTIAASFTLSTYNITASAGTGGSISPSGAVSVNCGANQSFTITADACYTIADVLVDGVSVGAVGTYDFTNVTAAHTIAASFTLSTYNITASAGTGGAISPSGVVSVNCGSNETFTITADACYTIADVLVDGVSVGAVGTYDFTNVTAAHTIAASFTLSTYNITASAGTGGSISPSGAVSVNCGASQSFTITADACYTIADVLVDGVSVGAVGTYDFTNVTAAHTIAASFTLSTYNITASAGTGGSISPSGSVSVNCGASQSFTITADACYTIADVLVDGVSVGAVGTYDFTNVTAAHTIAASFTLSTYNITASAGTGGSISPSGAVSVNCGANQSFTITADACYTIADVLVDGVSVGAVGTYDFTNVTAAHTIAASFTLSTYNITASAGTGGSISPSGSVSVNCGASQSFTITADACYTIADVLVDGVSVGAVGTYDFTNVTAAHTIAASFTLSTYNITASAGTGGAISPSGVVSVNCGASQSFTITADACYTIADVLVDGVSVGAVGTYDFTNVTAAHTIAASFTLSTYNITASAGTGGAISPSGVVSVNCGSNETFTITADACYTIADVLVDGVSVGAVGTYTFTNVTAAHTIAASFTLSTYNITASAGTGGAISPSGVVSVNCGSNETFTITADACYTIADVLVDGVSVGAVGTYTFTNVTAAHTIAASFNVIAYTITASAGANGSISPIGAVSVNCGTNQSFAITADPAYHIADVLVDGLSVGAVSTYPFSNVSANHTIEANFASNCVPPVADDPADVTICGSYTLPALSAGNRYYTATGGGGTELLAGYIVTSTQTIYVYAAATPPCLPAENSFVVTINTLPACSINGATTVCPSSTANSYTAVAGMSSYAWGISGNGIITGATNQQTVSVNAGALNNQTYTLTLTVSDGIGCSSTCNTIVNVSDNTAPVITTNNNVVLNFNSTTGPQTAYSEGGIIIRSLGNGSCPAPGFPYIQLGVNAGTASPSLQNHNANCVSVYSFTANNNAPFSFNSIVVNTETGPGIFYVYPGGTPFNIPIPGTYTFPAEFHNVTEIRWSQPGGYMTIDDLDVTTQSVATCQENIVTTNDRNSCGALVSFITPQVTDNCPGATITQTAGLPSGSLFPIGVTTNTFTATDGGGNITTCSFTVTVTDTQAPVFNNCPANISMGNTTGICGAVVNYSTPVGTDNCPAGLNTSLIEGLASGSTFPIGTTTVTYQATDASGNSAICSFTVTVNDTQAPEIDAAYNSVTLNFNSATGPQALSYTESGYTITSLGNGSCASPYVQLGVNAGTASPSLQNHNSACVTNYSIIANGNVPFSLISVDVKEATDFGTFTVYPGGATVTLGGVFGIYTFPTSFHNVTEVRWNQPSGYMTVDDMVLTTELISVCSDNIVRNAEAGTCGAVVNYNTRTATDNCPGVILIQTTGLASGSVFPVGTTTNTFVATDASGNSSTCSFDVIITDNEVPVLSNCPSDIIVNTGLGNTQCSQTATWTEPTATDNCTAPGAITWTKSHSPGDVFPVGTTQVTYIAADASGNTSTVCSFTVTVLDNTAPVIECPTDITVSSDAGLCSAVVIYTAPVGTDNCSGATTIQIAGLASGSVFPLGITTNTFSVSDALGNSTTCSFTVTVNDTEAPVISCPSDINVNNDEGLCSAVVTYTAPVGTDNCSGVTTIQIAGLASGSAFPAGVTTNTFRVSDASGNSTTCSFTVTVNDTEAPSIVCPGDITVSNDAGLCGAVVTYIAPVGTDVCSGAITTQIAGLESGSVFPVGTTTNTFSVSDAAGNSSTCTFTVTVNDTEAPVIECPTDITVSSDAGLCSAVVIYTAPVGTDNCSGATTIQIAGLASGSVFPLGITTNTFSVSDALGNSTTCSFTVTVNDTEAPVISCPSDINVNNDEGLCSAVVTYTAPVGTDNCSGVTTIQIAGLASGSAFPAGVTTNTFRVSDASGNSTTCSFTVTVNDTEAPSIVCPGDITVSNDAGLCGAVVTYIAPVGTDVCSGAITTQIAGLESGSVFPVGTTTNTFSVSDAAGNSATCTFIVTVTDTELPVITCAAPVSVSNDAGLCSAEVTLTAPSVSDNCGGTLTPTNDHASTTFPVGTTTVTWTVTDVHGNTATCTQDVTVTDTELPVITCAAPVSVSNDAGLCSAEVTLTAPSVSDNCGGTLTPTNDHASTTFPVGTTTVTWTVTDVHGNTATCTQDVTVTDTELPVITCAAPVSVSNDAGLCSAEVTLTAPSVSDNCGGTLTPTNDHASTTFPVGTTTVTWTVTDVHGNTATCTQDVTVTDTELPVITCAAPVSVSNDAGLCSAEVTLTAPSVSDNCGGTLTPTNDHASTTFPVGTTTVTWTVTDVHGNTATCTQDVTVTDTELPVITCAAPVSVSNDAGLCSAEVTLTAPSVSDNCGGTLTPTNDHASTTFPVGTTTVTWTVTDVHGNTATCTQDVTVTDTELPVITCAAPVSVSNDAGLCSAEVTLTAPSVSDNCGGTLTPTNDHASTTFPVGTTTVTWTVTDVHGNTATCTQDVTVTDTELPVITCAAPVSVSNDAGLCSAEVTLTAPSVSDNCGGTLTPTNDHASTTFPVGTTTVTWTVTDVHGNTATCTQDVTVTDTELPVITCAAPVSVSNDAGLCSAEVTLTAPSVSDNCGGTLTPTNDHASTTFPVGTTTVTWTVTDVHGNTATCTQDVTVTDTELPVITCAAPVSVSNDAGLCSAEVTLTAPSVSDNCGGTLTPTNDHASTTFPVGTTTVTWTVTDVHGNTATCTQDVTVTDTELPVITCAAPVSVSNDAGLCSAEVTLTAPSVSDNCGGTLTPTNDHASTTFPVGTTTVTWTVTDVHGNTATCTQDVTVTDTELPVITCAAPVSVSNDAGLCSAEVTLTAPSVSDNCGGTLTPTNDHASTTFPVGTTTVTWTVTDVHGNTATCTQDVTVTDTELPVITCAAPVSVSNDAGLCSAEVTLTAPSVSDNCGGTLTPTNDHASTTFPVGTTTVTWTVTDVHGNTATCTQDVTVTDTELPVITCAAPVSVSNDAGLCSAEVTLTAPSVSDNCGGTLTPTNDHASTTFPVGTTTVTWTVTDVHGNTATCTQDVTVTDTELPVITCAAPVSVSNDAGLCSAEVTLTAPSVSDNCGGTLTPTNDHASTTFPVGTTTVTWTVTDVHGNTATCTQDVTVTDTELPVITCAAPVSVSNDAGLCSAEVTLTAPSVSDNCGGTLTPTNDHASTTFPVGTTTVTWTVTDVHGNTATCTQDVTVTDTELPVITCAAPVSVSNDAGLCSAEVTLTAPSVSDNCGGTLTPTNDHASTTFPVGTTTVTWTVTDVHGNTATCTQDVTVTDTELPVITCAAPVSVSNDAGLCSAEVTLTAPSVSDNCGGTLTPTNDHASTTFPVGTTTVTWTVTDVHGNTATCTQTVTVVDNTKPDFTFCPSPVINALVNGAGCIATIATTNPTVTDNCSSISSLTWALTGATTGASAGTGMNYLGTYNFNMGTTTVTYTATDAAGNTRTCIFTVSVVNNLSGLISGTATVLQNGATTTDITFNGSLGVKPYTFTYNVSVNGGAAGPNQTVSTTGTNSAITVQQSNAVVGTYKYTLVSVTDALGCSGSIATAPANSATITVVNQVPNLSPSAFMNNINFASSEVGVNRDFIIEIDEISGAATSGTITLRISKPSAFNISFNPVSGVSDVFPGGTPNTNSDFTFTDAGSFYQLTTSVPIGAFGYKIAGLMINRKPGIPFNTTQNISIQIVPGSGGDTTNGNNLNSLKVTAN